MNEQKPHCPECESENPGAELDRRGFMRTVGGHAAAAVALGVVARTVPAVAADAPKVPEKPAKPAEDLIKELYTGLTADQKKLVVLPFDNPNRFRMYNRAMNKTIADSYTKPQQELVQRILRSICSDDEGYRRITRNGHFDSTGSFENCGANIFGDPTGGNKFAWVFTSHHLTVRCDGNSEEGAAFGGPLYYGHSAPGHSDKNVYNYQTKCVTSVFDALSEKQRKVALITGSNPGEGEKSIVIPKKDKANPGISYGELNKDQQALVEKVMREVLSPFRKEDGDEVVQIIKANGGLAKIHLAFYQDKMEDADKKRWHFWRLEGPGFVWNYRVLPHVHTYVNISSKL